MRLPLEEGELDIPGWTMDKFWHAVYKLTQR